jgi:hypothetical protein
MADVNSFIDQLGEDVSATCAPAVEAFVQQMGQQIAATVGPRLGQFIDELVRDLVAQQSKPIQDFLTKLTQDLARRYHPSVNGTLTARIVDNGIEIESTDTRLDVKNRTTSASIASLDIPVFVRIHFNDFLVKLDSTTVKMNDPHVG